MRLNRPIAEGSRTTIYAWGHDAVAKVPLPTTPAASIRDDALLCAAARRAGAPCPEFLGFETHDGREISVFRRVHGVEMWEDVRQHPERSAEHGRRLWAIQRDLAALAPPVELPQQVDRLRAKIGRAAAEIDPRLADALAAIPTGGDHRTVLCHGDLHPGNVILSTDGPIVVDWLDACAGDVLGDIARSTLLLGGEPQHLVGDHRDHGPVATLRSDYVDATTELGYRPATLARWRAVTAVARLAEGLPPDELLTIWHDWTRSPGGSSGGSGGDDSD